MERMVPYVAVWWINSWLVLCSRYIGLNKVYMFSLHALASALNQFGLSVITDKWNVSDYITALKQTLCSRCSGHKGSAARLVTKATTGFDISCCCFARSWFTSVPDFSCHAVFDSIVFWAPISSKVGPYQNLCTSMCCMTIMLGTHLEKG